MNGKEVYKYATQWVPKVIKKALDKINLGIEDVDMFIFHQANEKIIGSRWQELSSFIRSPTVNFGRQSACNYSIFGQYLRCNDSDDVGYDFEKQFRRFSHSKRSSGSFLRLLVLECTAMRLFISFKLRTNPNDFTIIRV